MCGVFKVCCCGCIEGMSMVVVIRSMLLTVMVEMMLLNRGRLKPPQPPLNNKFSAFDAY